MRVAFIAPFLFAVRRGLERACAHLANELATAGDSVTIMAWDESVRTTLPALDPRIRLVCVPRMRYFRAYWAIPFYATELLRQRYDAVAVFFAGHGEAEALYLASFLRRQAVSFLVGYPIELVPHRFREFNRYGVIRQVRHIIAVSGAMVPGIAQYYHRQVEVIPYGVDTNLFDPAKVASEAAREALQIAPGERVLLTTAALEWRKGIQHVLRALPHLLNRGVPVRYLVAGEGRDRAALENEAEALGIRRHVVFLGAVADPLPYYGLADIFLLPSHGEGLPNSLLEAWSMGLPAVVSHHPPYPDVVPPDIGYLVQEEDPEGIASVVTSLLGRPASLAAMKAACRRHAVENYGWPMIARRYREAFLQR